LQQPGVYVAVMNPAGRYSYSNAATLFTLSDIGVSAHRYHNRLDVFTQSLENGAAQSGIDVQLLNAKGQTLAQAKSDAQGHVTLQTDEKRRCCWREKTGRPPCWISNFPRWIWRSSRLPAPRASASSSLCLARAISIVREKR
jgi:hypothetical protein